MNYLLDTCVLSELTKPAPKLSVIAWIDEQDEETLFLSVLTLGEIQKGIFKLPNSKRRRRFQQWFSELEERFSGRALPIDENVSLVWGKLAGESEKKGRPLPVIDALIAATAIANNLTLVTRNTSDMSATRALILDLWQ